MALARDPAKVEPRDGLEVRPADVFDDTSVAQGAAGVEVALSGLGIGKGDDAATLVAGARALAATGVRFVWLGALGAGRSASHGGPLYHLVLRAFLKGELEQKAEADEIALAAGASVFHPGPLTGGELSESHRTTELSAFRRRLVVPPSISRATVAAAMLDEAESPRHAGSVCVPLKR